MSAAPAKAMRPAGQPDRPGVSLLLEVFTIAANQRLLPMEGWSLNRELRSVLPPLRAWLFGDDPPQAVASIVLALPSVVHLELTGSFARATAISPLQLPRGLRSLQLDGFEGQLGPVPATLQELHFTLGEEISMDVQTPRTRDEVVCKAACSILSALPLELRELTTDLPLDLVHGLSLPLGLHSLGLAALCFDGQLLRDTQTVGAVCALPPGLVRLRLDRLALSPQLVLPETLQELVIDTCVALAGTSRLQLPPGLRTLLLNINMEDDDDMEEDGGLVTIAALPPGLLKLHLIWHTGTPPLEQLPDMLQELHLEGEVCSVRLLPPGLQNPLPQLPFGLESLQMEDAFDEPMPLLPHSLRRLRLEPWDFSTDLALPDGLEVLQLSVEHWRLKEGCCMPVQPASLLQLTCWVHKVAGWDPDPDSPRPQLHLDSLPPLLQELALDGVQLRCPVRASVRMLRTGYDFDAAGLVFESGSPPARFEVDVACLT